MKLIASPTSTGISFALLIAFSSCVQGIWETDPRCPEPPNRRLAELSPPEPEEDAANLTALRNHLRGNEATEDPELLDFRMTMLAATVVEPEEPILDNDNEEHEKGTKMFEQRSLASRRYNLKMYWERGYCWQEEYSLERKWCMECEGKICEEDQILWLQECRNTLTQEFQWVEDDEDTESTKGRIKTTSANLCYTRITSNYYRLKRCSSSNKNQLFRGFHKDKPFEIKPHDDSNKCLNQEHHPKSGEEVKLTDCKLARIYLTNKWELYYETSSSSSNPEKQAPPPLHNSDPVCSSARPCNRCQGMQLSLISSCCCKMINIHHVLHISSTVLL